MSAKKNDNIIIPEEYLKIPTSYIDTKIQSIQPITSTNIINMQDPKIYRRIKNKFKKKQLIKLEESQMIPEASLEDPSKYATMTKSKAYTRKKFSIRNLFRGDILDIIEKIKNKINETRKQEKLLIKEKNILPDINIDIINENEIFALYTIRNKSTDINNNKNIAYYYDIITQRKKTIEVFLDYKYVYMFYISPESDNIAKKHKIKITYEDIVSLLHQDINYEVLARFNVKLREVMIKERPDIENIFDMYINGNSPKLIQKITAGKNITKKLLLQNNISRKNRKQ